MRNIDVSIPKNQLIVVTGVSGSGKSSLIVDTLYAEGQRRYVESLSAYARQFLNRMKKPEVDYIKGLCPAIAFIHYFSKLFGLYYKEIFHFAPGFSCKESLRRYYHYLCHEFNPLKLASDLQKNMQSCTDTLRYAKMSDFDKKEAIREQFVKTIPFEMLRNFILQYQNHCPEPGFDWSLLFFTETVKYMNNVNTGRLDDVLYAQLSEDGALDVLRMLGYVSAPDLCGYMRTADASSNPALDNINCIQKLFENL